jgi:glycerol-3-phosphate dehydrogenase (NAD(P)+)
VDGVSLDHGDESAPGRARIAVLGAGSWGTAFSAVLADAGTDTTLWARRTELARAIQDQRTNPDYLPGVALPDALRATDDIKEAVDGAQAVVFSVPSQNLREHLVDWSGALPSTALLVSLMKGVELGSSKRMSEVIAEITGVPHNRVAVVTGPNLAPEIARKQPAAAVIGCPDPESGRWLQRACHSGYFRPYTNTDVVGCELGGAVKNVIALAVGMAVGLGFGDNARASIITRGLAETARLGAVLGADPMTFAGLAGMGDLVATCTSSLSRNRTFGEQLGSGKSVAEAAGATDQIAEGVKSCRAIFALAERHRVPMPITEHVVRVVHDGMTVPDVVLSLISRDPGSERHPTF